MVSAPPTLITPKFAFTYPLSPNVCDYRCVINANLPKGPMACPCWT